MRISDLFIMCVRNMTRRKVRTMLTITGVVVGTCAIVVMISIGVGMQQSQEAALAEMGDLTMIDVYNWSGGSDGKLLLDDKALSEILEMDGVEVATPYYNDYSINLTMYAGNNDRYYSYTYDIVGIYPEALDAMGFQFVDGGYDPDAPAYTIYFGEKAAYAFRDSRKRPGYDRIYPWPDSNGNIRNPYIDLKTERITLKTDKQKDTAKVYEYKVNYGGTLLEDWNIGYETYMGFYMDVREYKRIAADYYKANGITKTEDSGYTTAKVKCVNINYVDQVQTAIGAMGYDTWSMENIRKPMQEQVQQTQMFLGGLAAISLFVAALGIANTMLMSIYERTREIGVMKVLGCFVGNIRTVFLMEAGGIGFIGGIIGVVLSYLISFLLNFFGFSLGSMGNTGYYGYGGASAGVSVIPNWLVGFGLVFATCIGLVSGFYPANRAVKISALEAIKQND